jgi:alkanesulfonate monooxygenase SsuD/methylene tetrahydromethanopterin reductase-like flavin-dependent oxidoreductase (luciferase family)
MRFGLFGGATARAGHASDSQIYREFVDYVCEAEELGFDSVFLVEHHFTGQAQVSATLTLLGYLAARTSRMRLGTAVTVLPWHNPVLLAEQAATVDLLSGGRLDLGIGRGYRHNEFSGFCIPVEEAGERYDEALAVIRKAWTTSGRFSHQGRFWRFADVMIEPPPLQKPHPPLWVGAASERSIRQAAENGFNLLLDQLGPPEVTGRRVATYRQAIEAQGRRFAPHTVGVTRALHVARNAHEREHAHEMRARFLINVQRLAADPNRPQSSLALPTSLEDTRAGTEQAALIGPPEEIIARLQALQAVGVDYVLLLDVTGSREALRLFAREVMPAFRQQREPTTAAGACLAAASTGPA